MYVVHNIVQGPFKDEAAFKAAVIKEWNKKSLYYTRFEIENEEKEPGMPDVLSISGKRSCPAYFTEFKRSDEKGVIKFEKTQPLFYRQHNDLPIEILAWDVPRNRVVLITPEEVVEAKALRIAIPDELKCY